jgi:hypothetical protein
MCSHVPAVGPVLAGPLGLADSGAVGTNHPSSGTARAARGSGAATGDFRVRWCDNLREERLADKEYVRQLTAARLVALPSVRKDVDFVLEFTQANIWDRQSPATSYEDTFTFGSDDEASDR